MNKRRRANALSDLLEEYSRALVCSRLFEGKAGKGDYVRHYNTFMNGSRSKLRVTEEAPTVGERVRLLYEHSIQKFDLAPYENAIDEFCQGRIFCSSERDQLGWAPLAAQPGDMVCIFWFQYTLRAAT